ncbi:MAG: Crp/Fnr family transcriptional regulator [Reichenbachiella sp.]
MNDCKSCNNSNCLIKQTSVHDAILDYHKKCRYGTNSCRTEAAAQLLEQKHTINCKAGQSFIIEGAPIHGLFFLYNGKVKIGNTGTFGKEQILRYTSNGDIIGHRGFGSSESYKIYATALEDSILCNFSNDVIMRMLEVIPNLTFSLMTFFAEELNRSETKVQKFAQMNVREKVIDSLLYVSRKFGTEDGYIGVQLSRREISDCAGTTEEQVIRVLSSLKKDEIIQSKGRAIYILDRNKLQSNIPEGHYFLNS